ncbi:MAG: hypothetical protein H0X33_04685 [Taibaiella sp.]|nr:hypothetical protein [Taibaiella sp.]
MKQQTRELLVTTKVAQQWQGDFDQKVEELMAIVSKVDSETNVYNTIEVLDVYRNTANPDTQGGNKKRVLANGKPFEFCVFRN